MLQLSTVLQRSLPYLVHYGPTMLCIDLVLGYIKTCRIEVIIWKIALHDEKYLTKANLFP